MAGPRLKDIVGEDDALERLSYYSTPTLPHLLALLHHPQPGFPPTGTSLLVIESISTVFSIAFPKGTEDAGARAGRQE